MKSTLSLFLFTLYFLSSYKKENDCVRTYDGCVPRIQPFFHAIGCSARVETKDGNIRVEVTEVEVNRAFEANCENEEKGTITTSYNIRQKVKKYNKFMTDLGCRRSQLHNVFSVVNPRIDIVEYELRLIKIYPISNEITAPVPQDDYDAVLVVHKR